jgi:hypothetical protein
MATSAAAAAARSGRTQASFPSMVARHPAKARHPINPTPDAEIDLVRGFRFRASSCRWRQWPGGVPRHAPGLASAVPSRAPVGPFRGHTRYPEPIVSRGNNLFRCHGQFYIVRTRVTDSLAVIAARSGSAGGRECPRPRATLRAFAVAVPRRRAPPRPGGWLFELAVRAGCLAAVAGSRLDRAGREYHHKLVVPGASRSAGRAASSPVGWCDRRLVFPARCSGPRA